MTAALAGALLLASAAPALAQRGPAPEAPAAAKAPSASKDGTLSLGVKEKVLANGLTILTIERPRAPRATCWLFVKTGSVNERPGITGISHLFEHLMFKGTKEIGVRDFALDQAIQPKMDAAWEALQAAEAKGDAAAAEAARKTFEALRKDEKANVIQDELWDLYLSNGGTGLNAFTSEDMTAYIVTLPSNKVELFMWLEADRLANAVFREFYPERDVVKEERRLDENRPDGPFEEELNALFFMAHPYGWPVVGWMSDLDAITPEDCRTYFDVFYAPNNCTLVVCGDVKAAEVERMAERYLGPIPRGKKAPPAVRTKEPAPAGERRLTVRRGDARPRATLLFHCPPMGHDDGPALSVAQQILSGKSGRLFETLVESKEIAIEVSASHDERRWAGVFRLDGYAKSGIAPEAVADAMQAELARLGSATITADEMTRAVNALEASLLRQLEDNESSTQLVGAYATVHDWRLLEKLPALWRAVTVDDVHRVVTKYLRPEVRTIGVLEEGEPGDPAEHEQGPDAPEGAAEPKSEPKAGEGK